MHSRRVSSECQLVLQQRAATEQSVLLCVQENLMPCCTFGLFHMFALGQLRCSWQVVHHVHYSVLYLFVCFDFVLSILLYQMHSRFLVGSECPYKHNTAVLQNPGKQGREKICMHSTAYDDTSQKKSYYQCMHQNMNETQEQRTITKLSERSESDRKNSCYTVYKSSKSVI